MKKGCVKIILLSQIILFEQLSHHKTRINYKKQKLNEDRCSSILHSICITAPKKAAVHYKNFHSMELGFYQIPPLLHSLFSSKQNV